jgi:thioredoxin-like negative regulator of GroEL
MQPVASFRRFDGADAIRWSASLKLSTGDRAGAMALYAKGVALHPRNTALRLGYSALLGDQGKYAEASRVLATGPQTTTTWSARVAFAARAKDEGALRRLYAELEHAPVEQRADNAFLLGQLAELLHRDHQALDWYGKVDSDGRRGFDAQVRSAVLLDKAGKAA